MTIRVEHAPPLAVAYVTGAAAGTAILVPALALGVLPSWSVLVWAISFGPLGIGLLVVAWALTAVVGASVRLDGAGHGADAVLLAALTAVAVVLCSGVALVNAVVVRRVQDRVRLDRDSGARAGFAGRLPFVWDRLVGASGFVLAGAAFVVLCVVDGGLAVLSDGVDVPIAPAIAETTRLLAGVTWVGGAGVAVTGLVLWIVSWRRGGPSARWAVGDLIAQLVLIAVPLTYSAVTGA